MYIYIINTYQFIFKYIFFLGIVDIDFQHVYCEDECFTIITLNLNRVSFLSPVACLNLNSYVINNYAIVTSTTLNVCNM